MSNRWEEKTAAGRGPFGTIKRAQAATMAYRVITDEPQGVAVGFEPSGVEFDEFPLLADDGGLYVGITDQGMYITSDPKQATEPTDLIVWRNPADFEEWYNEMFEGQEEQL